MSESFKLVGRKRAFTMSALLVVLTMVVLLALYLLPLVSHYRSQQAASTCIANLRRLGQSTLMYANDFDETLPQTVANVNGQWLTNFHYSVPQNWSSDVTHPAVIGSAFVWPNTCKQFGVIESDLSCPTQRSERSTLSRFTYDTPLAKPSVVSYSMNGYLNSYKLTDIANKSQVPFIWEGRGKSNPLGGVLNNPRLNCNDGTQTCTYNTSCDSNTNGGTGSAFGLASSVWTHGKTNHCLLVDGHVEQRKMGAVLSPENTDSSIDFYTGYNEAGIPGFTWTNGCHAWLFRPNR
jgi:hypothetical protein